MTTRWKQQQAENPEIAHIIVAGLDKLEDYRDRTELVPAYILAMGKRHSLVCYIMLRLYISLAVNPAMKFEWFRQHMPEKVQSAKDLFIREVNTAFTSYMFFSFIDPLHLHQLYSYQTEVHNTPARSQCDDTTWADDILGLNHSRIPMHCRTLEAEVDAYLLDSQVGTSCVNFWQVCLYIRPISIRRTDKYRFRRTNFAIRPYFCLQWTSSPFRHQLCHANAFSLQLRRR